MRLEERIRGTVRVEICGAELETLLNACLAEELPLLAPESLDVHTLRLRVWERDLPRLEKLAKKHFCELRVLSRRGGSRTRRLLRRRLGLLLLLALFLTAVTLATMFVWEIRIVGAEELSRPALLRELSALGLSYGAYRPGIDAERLRDEMLLREPRLLWMTVNVRGSVAEVQLLGRAEEPEIYVESEAAELRASRTGIVRRVDVRAGQARVLPGEAVTEGELLVSGSVDSITAAPRTVRAQGEVWADTWYELTALCPAASAKSGADEGARSRWAVKIGARRINFHQNGGKTIDGCDKIVHEYNLGIDGLFRLPVCLVREELRPYAAAGESRADAERAGQQLIAALAERIDGEIVSAQLSTAELPGLTVVTLRARCRENIARPSNTTP